MNFPKKLLLAEDICCTSSLTQTPILFLREIVSIIIKPFLTFSPFPILEQTTNEDNFLESPHIFILTVGSFSNIFVLVPYF